MSELQDYVKAEFFELPENQWSGLMIKDFILKSISLDTDVYEAIINIDHADLYQHIAEFDQQNVLRELDEIQDAMLVNAKAEINQIIEDIEADENCDDCESSSELRQEFDATESRAINND